MTIRIAVGSRYLADRPAADVVGIARRLGADGVDFSHAHLDRAIAMPDDAAADLAAVCSADGVTLLGATLPELAGTRAGDLAEEVWALSEQIGEASRIGVPAVSFSTGRRETLSMEMLVRGMRRLAETGAASHVRIAVVNRLGSRMEQIEDVRQFVASLRDPTLRLRLNTGEYYAAAVNPRDVLAEFSDLVDSVVLSDRRGREDVGLGEGQVNLAGLVGDLVRAGYDGWLVVNVRDNEAESINNPVEFARGLIGRVG